MAYSLKAIVCHLEGPLQSSVQIVSINQDTKDITMPFDQISVLISEQRRLRRVAHLCRLTRAFVSCIRSGSRGSPV